MNTRAGILPLLTVMLAISPLAGADLPSTWYRRAPVQLNGKDQPGRWNYREGDVITTGTRGQKTDSTAKLDYPDSSTINTRGNSEVIVHRGWLDVPVGGLAFNLVAGSKHFDQAETPVGIFRVHGATGEFDVLPAPADAPKNGPRDVVATVTAGAFEWQIALDGPRMAAWIDAGDKVRYTVAPETRTVNIQSDAGEAVLKLGSGVAVAVPAKGLAVVVYNPVKQEFLIQAGRGEVTVTARGAAARLAEGARTTQAVAVDSGKADRIESRRGVAAPPAAVASAVPYSPPAPLTRLPQGHAYQKTLRDFLATLVEADLDPGLPELKTAAAAENAEDQYRNWLLSLDLEPQVGRKRCYPSVSSPARLYLLNAIETPEGVRRPPAWVEPLAWLSEWNYPGNAYLGSKPLKMRAFVTASVMMMMLDHAQEHHPELGVSRASDVANHLIAYAYVYPRVRGVLPPTVRDAYLAGLKKLADRVAAWGPTSENISADLAAALGLYLTAEAAGDDVLRKRAETYARRLVTDPQFFHPAGYFVSMGSFDGAHNGSGRYFAVWLALLSDDPVLKEALDRTYRLRAHLALPDPDGHIGSPTHFSPFTSQESSMDSGGARYVDYAAAMLVDEAAYRTRLPGAEELNAAGMKRINELKAQIRETPNKTPPEQVASSPWKFIPQTTNWSFPRPLNIAEDAYRPGSYARLAKLHAESPSLLKVPFLRDESFLRTFDKAFTIGRNDHYGVVLHTGPVGGPRPDVRTYPGPHGFGGGQLSAFWTPKTGSVILGRRGGMDSLAWRDRLEDWRLWPIHAVSGTRHNGEIVTTGLIRELDVDQKINGTQGTVTVRGVVPPSQFQQPGVLTGKWDYQRSFTVGPERLTVETRIETTGQDTMSELVETIPVFLREMQKQRKSEPTRIEFQVNGAWKPAEPTYQSGVTAVRLTRFEGRVRIEFDRARRVKLSPQDWADEIHTRAACRNLMIDLLENDDRPAVPRSTTLRYDLRAESP